MKINIRLLEIRVFLIAIGPGMLIAATGVGAGDLATAAFAGSKLGVAVLWAVVLGAFIKYVVTEGLTRWQLATGETLLEGALLRLGRPARYFFITYFLVWTFSVGSSLISASGVAAYALFPVFSDPALGKVVFGITHSLLGFCLVWLGSFSLFSRIMSSSIAIMFVLVLVTALLVQPGWIDIGRGLFVPHIPSYFDQGTNQGVTWTLALMGGVGGTLTILSYGYWIRESGRDGVEALRTCRIDLSVAYTLTALFGIAVVIIANTSDLERQPSAELVVTLADRLGAALGSSGRLVFLVGAWAAMFSSLLGVWQSIPYMFADFIRITKYTAQPDRFSDPISTINTKGAPYRAYLIAITFVPMAGLWYDFERVQKLNALFGALVMPMLALVLMIMNGRRSWVGPQLNKPITQLILAGILAFFLYLGVPVFLRIIGGG